jgi:hypothetical protein|tara:strand:+ start:89 stop:331 length:243 start_codon:yes stop_codon:yes gene_type:complete
MDITQISIIFSILSCILSMILLPFTLYALILVKSLEKQTHTVQFMPVDQAVKDKFGESDNVIDEINQEQQDENEEIYRMV